MIDLETFIDIITDRLGNNKTREGVSKLFKLYDTEDEGFWILENFKTNKILINNNNNNIKIRFIDFTKLKTVAKELGETMNDDELHEMLHHIHILK